MKILIAPDSFKGSASSIEVAKSLAAGLQDWSTTLFDCQLHPLADGGEGTVAALLAAVGGKLVTNLVQDPLGREHSASWGLLAGGRAAVVEMASASGLPLLSQKERNPSLASSYGTGQLIRAALDAGVRAILLGLGGSATNDGGAGMAQALGYRLLDAKGKELAPGAAQLLKLASIDASRVDQRLFDCAIQVACDVTNPLLGKEGASAIYGPQKGANAEMVLQLDAALAKLALVVAKDMPMIGDAMQLAAQPGAGAAGGLGFGLQVFTAAKLRRGIDLVMELSGFEDLLATSDLVLSGEGCTDQQSLYGKVVMGVAKLALQHKVALVVFSGSLGTGAEALLNHGVTALFSIIDQAMSLDQAIADGNNLLRQSAYRCAPLLAALKKD